MIDPKPMTAERWQWLQDWAKTQDWAAQDLVHEIRRQREETARLRAERKEVWKPLLAAAKDVAAMTSGTQRDALLKDAIAKAEEDG